jgi:F-type H+-transporting ATPase subunit b
MHFGWSTLALQTINFAVLIWLLNRFLYRPVLRLMDARRAEIDRHYKSAQNAEAKAKEDLKAIEAERVGIAAERAAALKSAAAEADAATAVRRGQAEREAQALLKDARRTLAAEREQAVSDLRRMAFDLALDIAGRLLAEAPASLRAETWIDRVQERLAALPETDRESLIRQLADGEALKVVTAEALPIETAEHWRAGLRRTLGDRVNIVFETDPQLIAGAELHFPNAVLRSSWKSALAVLGKETEGHGDAC